MVEDLTNQRLWADEILEAEIKRRNAAIAIYYDNIKRLENEKIPLQSELWRRGKSVKEVI